MAFNLSKAVFIFIFYGVLLTVVNTESFILLEGCAIQRLKTNEIFYRAF